LFWFVCLLVSDSRLKIRIFLQLDITLEETTTDQVGVKSLEGVTASATSEVKSKRRTQSATRVAKTIGFDHVEETCDEKSVDQMSGLVQPLSVKTVAKSDKAKASKVPLQSGVS
jgi:hypothetical protein